MPFGVAGRVRARALLLVALCAAAGCSGAGVFREYEYEEEIYLAVDGSAVVNVHASVASLVALRGLDLNPDPRARIDQGRTRAFFDGPGARATALTLSRRDLRRFVHVSVRVDNVEQLSAIAPFAWSQYRFDRSGDPFRFRQTVGAPAGVQRADIRWTGQEVVVFKLHLPSEIVFHNAPSGQISRGNILEWEQPLADRLMGRPVEMEVHLERASILYTTLLLFGATIVAAVATLLFAVWWIARRGRGNDLGNQPSAP
jgi:hypothetical protein